MHQKQDKLQLRHQQVAVAINQWMHENIINRLNQLARKRPQLDIAIDDLVMEIRPATEPLRTNLHGPYLVVDINPAHNIAILRTGGKDLKDQRLFKRHISHLIK